MKPDDEFSERLRWARQRAGFKSTAAAAQQFGWNLDTYKSHDNGVRTPKDQATVEKYARAFHVDFGWLCIGLAAGSDKAPTGWRAAANKPPEPSKASLIEDIPILGGVGMADLQIGDGAQPKFVKRPRGLHEKRGVYALYVIGDNMAPAYRSGEIIFVDAEAEPEPGDFAVFEAVRFTGDPKSQRYFKQLKAESDTEYTFVQFSPVADDVFKRNYVKWARRVIPKSELKAEA